MLYFLNGAKAVLNFGMEHRLRFQNVFKIGKMRWLILVVLVAATHLVCQTLVLPYGLLSLLPGVDTPLRGTYTLSSRQSYTKHIRLGDPIVVNALQLVDSGKLKDGVDDNLDLDVDIDTDGDFPLDEEFSVESLKDRDDDLIFENTSKTLHGLTLERTVKMSDGISAKSSLDKGSRLKNDMKLNLSTDVKKSPVVKIQFPINENQILFQDDDHTALSNNSALLKKPMKKRMRCNTPPKMVTSIFQMNHLLVRHQKSSRAMRPRWSSVHDKEIVAAKLQIAAASDVKNDLELYPPLFRNVSMFRRSYELMERTLKVYVYKDGEKPIFHQPILKGLYASEGWFMKLMEGNKRFVVKDPKKAHLFYMPFSSRMLQHSLYVRNSHNRTNLRQYLKNYSEKLAAKYPFWNRTGGADHFLVACHDWAAYETRHHMEHCIKALCNADVTAGFKIGRDISLPEAYVRSARDPQRDLGGKPPSERDILAFYAGNMHGYLRQILLKFWNNKDPEMKIFGPMPPGVASKMSYIQHMKSSKYCICPKGYEVNSPRIVESIFYECVPVIISDNFVPPFFEVLDWDSFAVVVAEKDIPNLKAILVSIPYEKYLKMQLGVRKVQRHFLWNVKPVKYDLFHMTLHSIWYNRVFQFKPR